RDSLGLSCTLTVLSSLIVLLLSSAGLFFTKDVTAQLLLRCGTCPHHGNLPAFAHACPPAYRLSPGSDRAGSDVVVLDRDRTDRDRFGLSGVPGFLLMVWCHRGGRCGSRFSDRLPGLGRHCQNYGLDDE